MQMQAMGMPYPQMPKFPMSFNSGRNSRRKGRCRDFDNKGYCSRGSTCPYDHGNESIFVPPMGPPGDGKSPSITFFRPSIVAADSFSEYDPSNPVFSMANAEQMNPYNFNPEMGRGRGGRKGRNGRKGGSRAAFSADGPVHDRSKSTIVIENIPEESFTEEAVKEFFSQFGNIVETSMQPYKHLAIVKYDKWGSANAAYRSPKVIFDNRFVKVFWYKDEADGIPPSKPLNGNNNSNFGDQDQPLDQEPEPEIDMEEFQRRQEEAQKRQQEREAKRADLERQRQELEKQQQELLARHREENEKLQAKLSVQSGEEPSSGTGMLRAKLAALEQEAKMLGIDPNAAEEEYDFHSQRGGGFRGRGGYRGRGAPRGRGSFRGRGGMHAAYAQYSIDNRPKKVAVRGVDFTSSEKDESLRHFLLVRSPNSFSPNHLSQEIC